MSRSGLQNRTESKRNKQSCNGSRNGRCRTREIEGDVLRTVRRFGSEVTRSVKQRAAGLRDRATDLRERAADCVKQGRKKARSLERSVERRIEQRPLNTLLTAAGIGILIGVVAARRR